jgi:hypothetical protein
VIAARYDCGHRIPCIGQRRDGGAEISKTMACQLDNKFGGAKIETCAHRLGDLAGVR